MTFSECQKENLTGAHLVSGFQLFPFMRLTYSEKRIIIKRERNLQPEKTLDSVTVTEFIIEKRG